VAVVHRTDRAKLLEASALTWVQEKRLPLAGLPAVYSFSGYSRYAKASARQSTRGQTRAILAQRRPVGEQSEHATCPKTCPKFQFKNSCSLAGSSLVAESRFAMTTERATNQLQTYWLRVMVLDSAAALPTAVATITSSSKDPHGRLPKTLEKLAKSNRA